ncbi:hypothetical protein EIP86_002598 [Pleurotus ostreatoroseus]|nr:hypothetical protein EIP86_002598 [Pleurotus ostreatoroseus]
MHPAADLADWSKEHLIAYIRKLEASNQKLVKSRNPSYPRPAHPHPNRAAAQKPFDFAAHPRRKIALKFSYDGALYSGLAAQNSPTPLPTVEEVLWGALVFTRLVDPAGGFEGAGWEKCGRTDAGVSAAGQVVSFWIRSALPTEQQPEQAAGPSVPKPAPESAEAPSDATDGMETLGGLEGDFGALSTWDEPPSNTNLLPPPTSSTPASAPELKYINTLNNVLPPSIRALAWSPVAPAFSARFACTHRHYKYFFTSRGLDIDAMRDGAARLVGEHDFRNLCKLDPGKQLTTFRRRILRADINVVPGLSPADDDDDGPGQVYVLDLVGTAFLYNQVRHIMALLLLIGTRLEPPALLSALLNVSPSSPHPPFRADEPAPPVVPTKPLYQMADARPLMLWDCAYADEDVQWRVDGQGFGADTDGAKSSAGASTVFASSRAAYEQALIRAAMAGQFLRAAGRHHAPPPRYLPVPLGDGLNNINNKPGAVFGVPVGGGKERRGAKYVPVLERGRMEPVEVLNERWRATKGARRAGRSTDVAEETADEYLD